jgi:hypothetical protein
VGHAGRDVTDTEDLRRQSPARTFALVFGAVYLIVGATYLLVGVIGFWAVGEEWNILSLNQADNWLHVVTAILALTAVGMERDRAVATRAPA